MILFDTETTGLLLPEMARVEDQPHVIEIGAYCTQTDRWFETLVKPPVKISAEITKITGISNEMVEGAPEAADVLPAFADFVLGSRSWCAHNLSFDLGVLVVELRRLGMEHQFPYPPLALCTVERTSDLGLPDRKLVTLYKHLTGETFKQTHRCRGDVEALKAVAAALHAQGRLV